MQKRPAPSNGNIQLRKKGSGSGGQCTTTAMMLKFVWLIAGGLLLVSISMYMNILNPMNDNPTIHQQKIQTEEEAADRRVAEKQSTDQPKEVINDVDTTTNDQNNTQSSTSSDEILLLQWLRTRHMSASSTTASTTFSQLLSSPIYFAPGSLPITQLSTLQQCYTNTTIYRDHFKESPTRRIPYSKKYELAYILLPKSGSSTGRFMMQHEFDATEQRITISPGLQNVITFVREPLSRFYSQYDEAYVRTAPWQKGQNVYYIDSTGTNKKKATTVKHPFPYLHENMSSYHDYEDAFCPPTKRKHRKDCIYAQSQENGMLASRLERFVQDYNGRNIFDIHLALQVPLLSNVNDGRSLYITELHNTSNSESDWNTIAKRYIGEETILQNAKKNIKGDTKESGGVIQGRSYPRRFNKTLVSDLTERRICELVLLDYCCLNFPLPSVCSTSGGSDGSDGSSNNNLSCMMDYDNVNGRVRIQPSIFPDKRSK